MLVQGAVVAGLAYVIDCERFEPDGWQARVDGPDWLATGRLIWQGATALTVPATTGNQPYIYTSPHLR